MKDNCFVPSLISVTFNPMYDYKRPSYIFTYSGGKKTNKLLTSVSVDILEFWYLILLKVFFSLWCDRLIGTTVHYLVKPNRSVREKFERSLTVRRGETERRWTTDPRPTPRAPDFKFYVDQVVNRRLWVYRDVVLLTILSSEVIGQNDFYSNKTTKTIGATITLTKDIPL